MGKPKLSLTTAPSERFTIEVDGTEYPLRRRQDMSVAEDAMAMHLFSSIGAFTPGEDADQSAHDLGERTYHLITIILDAPREVIEKLSAHALVQIMKFWGEDSRSTLAPLFPASEKSPDSSDSTEALPKAG
jgi:hypothetical protein